jgi:site-specific DNA-methyltransferase (adenine-specific)
MEQRAFGQSGGAQGALAGGDDEYLQNSIGLNRIKRVRNHHPTVKPIALMRWLVRLVMPPGGTVLDPFAGSGTTLMAAVLEGFNCIGIEREQDYIEIAGARIEWAKKQAEGAGAQGQLGLPATPAG